MLRHFGTGPDMPVDNRACMVVIDAHTDTVKSDSSGVVGNHNWICPLYPFPLASLVWTHTIAGFHNANSGKVRGFYFSISEWGTGDPLLNALAIGLDHVSQIAPFAAGLSLFVSIDLDFSCIENNTTGEDTSAMARSYRENGLTLLSFYGSENETPEDIRDLLGTRE
jgi:hypothetical protein